VSSATPSTTRAYERIGVPTLVVEGGEDKLLPAGWAAEIAKQIDGARSVVVDKAGHCPQIEQPSVVNQLLADFWAQSERRKT
jgi:pimeloyl-ACP methyl ester carboxylesterase